MQGILKQSTAQTVKMGPFVDSSDGNTEETALTIAQADIRVAKDGGAFAQTNNTAGATHDENGMYDVPLDATDTGTLGMLRVYIHVSGALPVWRDFTVVPANVYDSLVAGSDRLETDVWESRGIDLQAPNGSGRFRVHVSTGVDPIGTAMRGTDGALTSADEPVDANITHYLGSAITETSAGQIAGRVSDFFDAGAAGHTVADDVLVSGDLPIAVNVTQWRGSQPAVLSGTYVQARTEAGQQIASQSDVQGITQAQRIRISAPQQLERPDSGSTTYRIYVYAYDEQHQAEDLDSNPSISVENESGTDRSANLSAVTKPTGTTGIYYADYTLSSGDALEQLTIKVDATEGGVTTQYATATIVVDTTAVDFTSADRTKLEAIHGKLPGKSYLTGTANADGDLQLDEATGEAAIDMTQATPGGGTTGGRLDNADVATSTRSNHSASAVTGGTTVAQAESNIRGADSDTLKTLSDAQDTLLGRITANLFSGITSLAEWLGLLAGKQTGNATARSEIRATGAGGGTYDETTDSQEAIRDRGDSSWSSSGSFWSTTEQEQIRQALGLTGTTAATTGNGHIDAIKQTTDSIGGSTVVFPDLFDKSGNISELITGDDYSQAAGQPLEWESDGWPDLTGATIKFSLRNLATGSDDIDDVAGSVVTAGSGTQKVRVELTNAQTSPLTVGVNKYRFDVQADLSGGAKVTLATGYVEKVRPDYTA